MFSDFRYKTAIAIAALIFATLCCHTTALPVSKHADTATQVPELDTCTNIRFNVDDLTTGKHYSTTEEFKSIGTTLVQTNLSLAGNGAQTYGGKFGFRYDWEQHCLQAYNGLSFSSQGWGKSLDQKDAGCRYGYLIGTEEYLTFNKNFLFSPAIPRDGPKTSLITNYHTRQVVNASFSAELSCTGTCQPFPATKEFMFSCMDPNTLMTTAIDPMPKGYKTLTVAFQSQCEYACVSDKNCLFGIFNGATNGDANKRGTCTLHTVKDLPTSDFKTTKPANTRMSLVVGSLDNIVGLVSLITSLKDNRDEMFQARAFAAMATTYYSHNEEVRIWIEVAHALTTNIPSPALHRVIKLPALDGPNTVQAFMTGQAALTNLDNRISAYKIGQNTADIEKAIAEAQYSSFQPSLAQGNFDMQLAIAAYNRDCNSIKGSLKSTSGLLQKVQDKMDAVSFDANLSAEMNILFAASRLAVSTAALANIFGDNAASAAIMMNNIKALSGAINEAGVMLATDAMFNSAASDLSKLLNDSAPVLQAATKAAEVVDPFIKSFKDNSFEAHITEQQIKDFVASYQNMTSMFSGSKLHTSLTELSSGANRLCQEAVNSDLVPAGAMFVKDCADVSAIIGEIGTSMIPLNTLMFSRMDKAAHIISHYLWLQKTNRVQKAAAAKSVVKAKDVSLYEAMIVKVATQ
eukprot:Nk52_evm10s326 gene=Nk52_evmTU10s326